MTVRTTTGNTPFSLVHRCKAVISLEIQIPSLRVALVIEMTDENHRLRLQELEALDEKRLHAQLRIGLYQARISKAGSNLKGLQQKDQREFFRREIWSWLSDDLWS